MGSVVQFLLAHGVDYSIIARIAVAVGFLCGFLLCLHFRQKWLRLLLLGLAGAAGGMVMMKVFGLASKAIYWRSIGKAFDFFELLGHSGYVFYGGLLGGFAVYALLFPRFAPRPRLTWDIATVSVVLAHAVARIGCYFAYRWVDGELVWHPCCYGVRMDNAFCAHFWDSRLPTQLIESVFEFLLFAVLLALLLRGGRKWRGRLPVVYLVAYPIFRYIIEFFRDDAARGHIGPLSFSQVISLLILSAVWLIATLRQKGVLKPFPEDKEDPEPAGRP